MKKICTYTVINNDTVEVYGPSGSIFLLFTCDLELAKKDENCWACFQREPGFEPKTALTHLLEVWPNLEWSDNGPPALIPKSDVQAPTN